MSRCRFFRIDINCLQKHSILLCIAIGCLCRKIFNLRICFKHSKCISGKDFSSCTCPTSVFPLLYFPVTKYLFRISWLRSCTCRCFRFIYISMWICRSSGAAICVIFHYDTSSTFQGRMPLRINIKFRGDPETVSSIVSCCIGVRLRINQETIIIISVCHIDSLIIRRCN